MEQEDHRIEPGSWSRLPQLRTADTTAAAVAEVKERLNERGPHAALEYLNARVRYRFTGVYRAEPPLLRNIFLFDRENPALRVTTGAANPLDETYCGIVVSGDGEFATGDATLDTRLAPHPARESVISYAGVPLRLASGRPWGTLCHYDVRPRLLIGAELAVLHAAASVFMSWLPEQAQPVAPSVRAGA